MTGVPNAYRYYGLLHSFLCFSFYLPLFRTRLLHFAQKSFFILILSYHFLLHIYAIPGYSPLNTAGFPDLKFVSPTQGMSPNQGMSPAHLAGNRNATSPGAGNIVLTGLSGMNSTPPGVGGSTDIQ